MKGTLCLVALILAAASASGVIEEQLKSQQGFNCDASLTDYKVTLFDVTPWPITKNTNLHLNMSGTMVAADELAETYVNVLYGGQQFYVQKFTNTDTPSAGTYSTQVTAFLPSFAPSGQYGVQVKLQNKAGKFLNCWQVNFTI